MNSKIKGASKAGKRPKRVKHCLIREDSSDEEEAPPSLLKWWYHAAYHIISRCITPHTMAYHERTSRPLADTVSVVSYAYRNVSYMYHIVSTAIVSWDCINLYQRYQRYPEFRYQKWGVFDTVAGLDTAVIWAPFLIRSINQYRTCGIMVFSIKQYQSYQKVSWYKC